MKKIMLKKDGVGQQVKQVVNEAIDQKVAVKLEKRNWTKIKELRRLR